MVELMSFGVLYVCFLGIIEIKYKYVSNNKKEIIFLTIFGGVAFVLFFWKILFEGYQLSFTSLMYAMPPFSQNGIEIDGPLLSDPMDAFIPFIYEFFQEHNFLFWSSSTVFGLPVLPKFILNPLNIGYWISMEYGQSLQYILKYSLAFLGMYLFLKNTKLNKYASYVGAITYAFSSAIVMWGGWPHSDVIALAPFLFYAIDKLVDIYSGVESGNKVKYYVLFIVSLYIMLIVGMPTYVAYFMYLGIIYTFFRLQITFGIKRNWKVMLYFLVTVGVSILIAAFMSLPYLAELYGQVSDYAETRGVYAFATLDVKYLLGFIFPYYKGYRTMHINESSIYTGLLLLFFFIMTPVYYKKLKKGDGQKVIFWGMAFVIVLLIVFTKQSGIIYQFIPLINTSSKIRLLVLLNFIGSVLAAWVMQYLTEYPTSKYIMSVLIIPLSILGYYMAFIGDESELWPIKLSVALAVAVILLGMLKKYKRLLLSVLMLICTIDAAMFASEYLPLISDSAEAIPDTNSSISYMQDNCSEGERMLPIGAWVFPPATNIFYDLNTIVGHVFVNTNQDITNYLETVDDEMYVTATHTLISKVSSIDNYELLSYASVKYLYYELPESEISDLTNILEDKNAVRNPVLYDGSEMVSQEILLKQAVDNIEILLSTYNEVLSKNDSLIISIYEKDGTLIHKEEIILSRLEDNSFYAIDLNSKPLNKIGEKYSVTFEGNHVYEHPIALWLSDKDIYDGDCDYDDTEGDVCLVTSYMGNGAMQFDDMIVEELEAYSPRAFIATNFIATDTQEQVLEIMAEEYLQNTAFILNETYEKYTLDTSNEQENNLVTSFEDTENEVHITVETTGNNMLVLNDYYYPGWKAYVNGEEVEIEKANYLFRGIYLEEAGEHEIVFKYFPVRIIIEYCIWGLMIACLACMLIFNKKINIIMQHQIEKLTIREK